MRNQKLKKLAIPVLLLITFISPVIVNAGVPNSELETAAYITKKIGPPDNLGEIDDSVIASIRKAANNITGDISGFTGKEIEKIKDAINNRGIKFNADTYDFLKNNDGITDANKISLDDYLDKDLGRFNQRQLDLGIDPGRKQLIVAGVKAVDLAKNLATKGYDEMVSVVNTIKNSRAAEFVKLKWFDNLVSSLDDIHPALKNLGPNKIHHILKHKHLWAKVVSDPNDWKQVAKVITDALKYGVESPYKSVYEYGGEVIQVTYRIAEDGTKLVSDAWVVR